VLADVDEAAAEVPTVATSAPRGSDVSAGGASSLDDNTAAHTSVAPLLAPGRTVNVMSMSPSGLHSPLRTASSPLLPLLPLLCCTA
jgi:hypothetical protein